MRWSSALCLPVADAAEAAAHHRIRHDVFVVEQGVFPRSDVDARDASPDTIKVLGWVEGVPAGAVRLYPLEDGRWQGDRLAVLPPYRARAVGGPLVRFAVERAAHLGGREMVAHVQLANVRFFEHLGWHCRGEVETYVGRPHQPMAIDLSALAALRSAAAGRSPARR